MMSVREWLEQNTAGGAAVVMGGDNADVLDLIFQSWDQKPAVLSDAVYGRLIAEAAGARLTSMPRILQSRGLYQDFRAPLNGQAQGWAIVPGDVTRRSLHGDADTVTQHAALIAGYAPPAALVLEAVAKRAASRLAKVGPRCASPVLVHDPDQRLSGHLPAGFRRLSFQGADGAGPHAPPSDAQPDAVPMMTVQKHAEFLAETELDVLQSMHKPLPLTEFETIYVYWYQRFSDLARAPQTASVGQASMARLRALAQTV